MGSIPKVTDLVVNNDICVGCGLCTFRCRSKAIEMQWNEYGFLIPVLTGTCNASGNCITVFPFNPYPKAEVRTETELAEVCLKEASSTHPKIGKYNGLYAGYAPEFRITSSSGGLATYILTELLERGIADHVFSVKESGNEGTHYAYAVSSNKEELLAGSKTRYFPVTLSSVFSEIEKLNGKVAIVGIGCFIKAIRLAQVADPSLKEKITFLTGIICGGMKSRFFTEYLAEKSGVPKDQYCKPEFRIKDPHSTASDYSFGCHNKKGTDQKTIKMNTVSDMWGTGFFKNNACDFCDDVTTELADISLGDAWLNPYAADGRGTNVIVTRSPLARLLIEEGIRSGKLKVEELQLSRFLASQEGSFSHRHSGLPFRIRKARQNGQLVTPKRFGQKGALTFDYKFIQYLRMKIRRKTLTLWKNVPDTRTFDKKMRMDLLILQKATRFYHIKKRITNKIAGR